MNVVTGAFGYSGKYIARRLVNAGETVITLTGEVNRSNEFGAAVRAFPFRFEAPEAMAASIAGAHTLYNTYWVRFDRKNESHDRAVRNTVALVRAAKIAGVRRIVHISITNPSLDSRLPYFRGKALLEQEIR
jgi:NADH dehydrogenase